MPPTVPCVTIEGFEKNVASGVRKGCWCGFPKNHRWEQVWPLTTLECLITCTPHLTFRRSIRHWCKNINLCLSAMTTWEYIATNDLREGIDYEIIEISTIQESGRNRTSGTATDRTTNVQERTSCTQDHQTRTARIRKICYGIIEYDIDRHESTATNVQNGTCASRAWPGQRYR